jgi:4'-phosphopantetheinyl transferase
MLYVFAGINQLPDDFIRICSYFLPDWRKGQMMGYRFPSDRKLCATAYLMVVYALINEGLYKGLPEFGYRACGKPFLSNYPGIYFNLSHCQDIVVCALSGSEVGVDVEKVSDYDDDLARAICNDDEYRQVTVSQDPEKRAKKFTELWTRKESIGKWHGTGLDCDPKEILNFCLPGDVDINPRTTSLYSCEGNYYISLTKNNQEILRT